MSARQLRRIFFLGVTFALDENFVDISRGKLGAVFSRNSEF
jgi:hypothetical protein